jgi:hypothetical protein
MALKMIKKIINSELNLNIMKFIFPINFITKTIIEKKLEQEKV